MAHLLGGENLHLSFPTRTVLEGVTVGIDAGDRIGTCKVLYQLWKDFTDEVAYPFPGSANTIFPHNCDCEPCSSHKKKHDTCTQSRYQAEDVSHGFPQLPGFG